MVADIKSYSEFKKYFQRHEQVCIGGIDWRTHGYITQIDEFGIILVQLRNAKEIRYGWNNLEVIYHTGVRIRSVNEYDMADIFTIKLTKQSDYDSLTSLSTPFLKQSDLIEFISFGNFNLTSEDIWLKKNKLRVKIRGYEGNVEMYLTPKEVVLYPTRSKVLMSTFCHVIASINIKGRYSFFSITLSNQEALDDFRNREKISFQPIGSGDPYIYEGIFLDDQIVKTAQGYIFLNNNADIYL